jgi:hypothetical protein
VPASCAPSGTITGIGFYQDSANRVWAALQAYGQAVCTAGNGNWKWDYQGNSLRGGFGQPASPKATNSPFAANGSNQLQEFWTLRAIVQQNWQSLPCVHSYTDETLVPDMGGDAGTSTVASIPSGTTACVLVPGGLTNGFVVALNYAFWQGMPVNIAADTGAEQVISVGAQGVGCANASAYLVTFSYSTSGMTVGEVVHFANPAPWNTFYESAECYQDDNQHFGVRCYQLMVSEWMQQTLQGSTP